MRRSGPSALLARGLARLSYGAAQFFLVGGRLGRKLARPLLRRAAQLQPDFDAAWGYSDYLEGLVAMEQGEPEEALRLLHRAQKRLPQDAAIALDAALTMTIVGRHQEAVELIEEALERHPRLAEERQLWTALAWSYLRLGRYRAVLRTADSALEHKTAGAQLRLAQTLALLVRDRALEAGSLQELLRRQPGLLPPTLEFAGQLVAEERVREADLLAGGLPPEAAGGALQLLATAATQEGKLAVFDWAMGHLTKYEPDPLRYQMLLAEAAIHRGRLDEALRETEKAMAENKYEGPAPHEQRGRILLLAEGPEAAYPALVEAVEQGSISALAGGVMAHRLLDEGQREKARQLFRRTRSGGALGVLIAHLATARLELGEGHPEAALELAEAATEEWGDIPEWEFTPPVREYLQGLAVRVREELEQYEESAARGSE